jgi:hypothetical protein
MSGATPRAHRPIVIPASGVYCGARPGPGAASGRSGVGKRRRTLKLANEATGPHCVTVARKGGTEQACGHFTVDRLAGLRSRGRVGWRGVCGRCGHGCSRLRGRLNPVADGEARERQ